MLTPRYRRLFHFNTSIGFATGSNFISFGGEETLYVFAAVTLKKDFAAACRAAAAESLFELGSDSGRSLVISKTANYGHTLTGTAFAFIKYSKSCRLIFFVSCFAGGHFRCRCIVADGECFAECFKCVTPVFSHIQSDFAGRFNR